MSTLRQRLAEFMVKWGGRSGPLVLTNILRKQNILDIEHMNDLEKEALMYALTREYFSSFMGHSRFTVARAELVSLLGMGGDYYRINDAGYRQSPRSPDMMPKPRV